MVCITTTFLWVLLSSRISSAQDLEAPVFFYAPEGEVTRLHGEAVIAYTFEQFLLLQEIDNELYRTTLLVKQLREREVLLEKKVSLAQEGADLLVEKHLKREELLQTRLARGERVISSLESQLAKSTRTSSRLKITSLALGTAVLAAFLVTYSVTK